MNLKSNIIEPILFDHKDDGHTIMIDKLCKALRRELNKNLRKIRTYDSDCFREGQVDMLMQVRDSFK